MVRTSLRSQSVKVAAKSPVNKVKKVAKNTKITKRLAVKPAKKSLPAKKNGVKKSVKAVSQSVPKALTKKTQIKKARKQKGQNSSIKGYTSDQYKKFLQKKKQLNDWSNQKLKDNLRKNLQSMSGNKDQLVLKVADGIVLGRIPRCPKCFGGRPKFDYKKGTYYCSGYRDDTDFINCHSTFQLSDIKRDPWEL